MAGTRKIKTTWKSKPTREGAGVHLKRAFGFQEVPDLDPFLLLDDFRSDDPARYLAGFPWHPHRGIETITYMLRDTAEHGDSMGNNGVIVPGDVQWMTAGSGIVHQEMPKAGADGRMGGFQLWANLPAARKMMPPRHREVKREQIPEVDTGGGAVIRVICGAVEGVRGPVQDIVTNPSYLDVRMQPESRFSLPTPPGHTVFAYLIGGRARCGNGTAPPDAQDWGEEDRGAGGNPWLEDENLILFEDGDPASTGCAWSTTS